MYPPTLSFILGDIQKILQRSPLLNILGHRDAITVAVRIKDFLFLLCFNVSFYSNCKTSVDL